MVEVLLHAGLPKTGTTTIQNWLVENAVRLRTGGIFTPSRFELVHRLAVEAITSPERRAQPDFPAIMAWPLEKTKAELRDASHDVNIQRIVLSSEYFSIAEPQLVKALLSDLSLHDVKIIFTLRRQDRLIESGFNQEVKMMGSTLPPIAKAKYQRGYDWHVLVSSWANVFDREKVVLRLYGEYGPAKEQIVDQVFGSLDPVLKELAHAHAPAKERSNPSLSASLIEFKRLANCVGAHDVLPILERASQKGLEGPPFRLKRDLAKQVLDIYRESNRKVAREFFNREGDLFDESDLEGESVGADYTGNLPVETLAMLFALHLQDQAEQTKRLNEAIKRLTDEVRAILRNPGEPQEG
jgi:hypothetical protein